MNVLVSSLLDVRRAPNSRLLYLLEGLAADHDVTFVCPRDTWRPSQTDVSKYGTEERLQDADIDIRYLTEADVSPIVQEVGAELFVRRLDLDWRAFDVHLTHGTLFLGRSVSRRLDGTPTVYDIADDIVSMVGASPQLPAPLRRIGAHVSAYTLQRSLDEADEITYISEALRHELDIDDERSTWIPNGVDTDLFHDRVKAAEITGLETEHTVGYVGTNREWVALPGLVDVVADLRADGYDVGLVVVGDEGGIEPVTKRASERGIADYCRFTGTVPYRDVPSYMRAMDVGTIPFLPGKISENSLPLKLFEYMACGLPVVSTSIPGVREVAADIARISDDHAGFKRELEFLLTNDDERARIGQAGRTLVEQQFSWRKQVMAMNEVLRDVTPLIEVP